MIAVRAGALGYWSVSRYKVSYRIWQWAYRERKTRGYTLRNSINLDNLFLQNNMNRWYWRKKRFSNNINKFKKKSSSEYSFIRNGNLSKMIFLTMSKVVAFYNCLHVNIARRWQRLYMKSRTNLTFSFQQFFMLANNTKFALAHVSSATIRLHPSWSSVSTS